MTLPDPTRSLGYQLVSWIEHYLVHGPGDVQGDRIELDPELAAFVVKCYEVDEHGRRVIDEAFFSRSKGRAKSELAGMLVCVEFVGPCRFSHFAGDGEVSPWGYEYLPGEPVGMAVTYPFIRCLATEECQSGNTYDNVTFMLEHLVEQHGGDFPKVDVGQRAQTSTRVFLAGGGEIRPSTASSAAKDGGKETFTVADETHLYTTPELRRMYDVVRRNGRKRLAAEPWLLQTSTMYGVGEDSIAERTHLAVSTGRVKGLLFDHIEAPEHLDPEKAEDRLAGLKVCYGPAAKWMGLEAMVSDYRDPRIDPADWLRYFWNRPMAGVSDFVDGAVWDSVAMPDEPLRRGEAITLGFDGSRSDDTTALIACRMADCRLFEIKVWQRPADAEDGWRVPRDEVDALLTTVFDTYAVAIVFADPSKWEPYLDAWSARWPKRVAEEWPGDKRTDRNVRLFRTLLRDGTLTHDGSDVLTRHIKNAALVKGKHKPAQEITSDSDDPLARNYLRIKKKGAGKIDAAWAAMLAVAARGWAVEHGIDPKRRSSTFLSL